MKLFSAPGIAESLCVPAYHSVKPVNVRRFVEVIDMVKERAS